MAEERNVEGVIVDVGGGQWTTKALIQTDDGTRVMAHFSDIEQELLEPERFRTGTRIRLDVPARYTYVRQENLGSGRPFSYGVPARPPFAHPRQAEWIDGAGRAHPLVRDVGHEAEDIHPGWDQVEGHPIYSDPQGPYGDRIATEPAPGRGENRTSTLNETKREGENVEGVIVGLEVDEGETTALIETDDGLRVEAPFNHGDFVGPSLFREGMRVRLDVPLRYLYRETVQGPDGEVIDVDPQDRRPFAVANSAEWIDSTGQAHPVVVPIHEVSAKIEDHSGWTQGQGHPNVHDRGLEGLSDADGQRVPEPLRHRASSLVAPEGEGMSPGPGPVKGRTDADGATAATDGNTPRGKVRDVTNLGKKTVQGNLTADPRQVQSKAGQKLVVFKMAENHRRYDEAEQKWKDAEPTFYDVAVDRERLAANVLNSVHKGDRVTVAGNYQVDAYATSTGEPGLNHRIWAEDVAASLQHNRVEIIPRDRTHDTDRWLGQATEQGLKASAPAASPAQAATSGVSHVDPGTAPGVRPEQVTPEAYAAWSAQQGSMYAQAQQQGVSGPTR